MRHKNGNGKKDPRSEVGPETFLDRTSRVLGDSTVINSDIRFQSDADHSHVTECVLIRAVLKNTIVTQSTFTNVHFEGETAYRSQISNSRVFGESKVVNAMLNGVGATNLNIFNATLETPHSSWNMTDFHHGYILRGHWTRVPRFKHFGPKGVVLMESVPGFLTVNCTEYPIDDWIARAKRYGKLYKLTDLEILDCINFAKLLLREPVGSAVSLPAVPKSALTDGADMPAHLLKA